MIVVQLSRYPIIQVSMSNKFDMKDFQKKQLQIKYIEENFYHKVKARTHKEIL